jgi:hypothetical protein
MAVHLAFAVHFQHPPEHDGTREKATPKAFFAVINYLP